MASCVFLSGLSGKNPYCYWKAYPTPPKPTRPTRAAGSEARCQSSSNSGRSTKSRSRRKGTTIVETDATKIVGRASAHDVLPCFLSEWLTSCGRVKVVGDRPRVYANLGSRVGVTRKCGVVRRRLHSANICRTETGERSKCTAEQ